MAITIVSSPKKISLAYNPIEIQVSSDEQDRVDFRYKVEVKDSLGNVLSTKKLIGGALITDVTTIDVSGMLRRIQNLHTWRYGVTGSEYVYFDATFRPGYSVVISESYDGTLHDVETITGKYTIPASLPSIKFPSYDYDEVIIKGKWLTNFTNISVRNTDKLVSSFLCTSAGLTDVKYDFWEGNTIVRTDTVDYTGVISVALTAYDVIHIHSGLTEIVTATGAPVGLIDTCTKYAITIEDEVLFFNVVHNCRFPGVRLHYLNEWGAVDSFLFSLAHRRAASIEKKKAKFNFTGSQLRPSTYGLGNTPYFVRFTDSLKLTSNFINDEDSNALLELFTSPIVSLECEEKLFLSVYDEAGKLILPCELDLSTYDIKQSSIEKLFNLEIDVKVSVDNVRQSL